MNARQKKIDAFMQTLTPQELDYAKHKIGSLRAVGGNPNQSTAAGEDWVLTTIIDKMREHGELSSVHRLTQTKDHPAYAEKRDELIPWLKKNSVARDAKPNRLAQTRLLKAGIHYLYQNLKTEKGHVDEKTKKWVPHPTDVNARHIMQHLHRLPGVLNAQLPGYAENGMMHMFLGMKRIDNQEFNENPKAEAQQKKDIAAEQRRKRQNVERKAQSKQAVLDKQRAEERMEQRNRQYEEG